MSSKSDPNSSSPGFNIVEASIAQHQEALVTGRITSVDLVVSYLLRIATYDTVHGFNAFTVFNPNVLDEAAESDARREAGLSRRPLEGIPYTIKDSYKVTGLSVTNGSPALEGLMSNEDSDIARQLRDAGAILLGKTNMPPMAAGGMQRGLYGRPESPYNRKYLPAAFSSGSSSGAAVSVACSMGVFGMASETVSSGRSPASNNALVAYTPSKGVLSCRGLWPLYVTCDVPVPLARSVEDMLAILDVLGAPQQETAGDFWREQTIVPLPIPPKPYYSSLAKLDALCGKRIGVPRMYIGQHDSDPHAKPTTVSPEVIALWQKATAHLEALGAEIIPTDFPLVTNYENDSASGLTNNVLGAPADWNLVERSTLIAKAWSTFLAQNGDPKMNNLAAVDPALLFPKPEPYLPDTWLEVRNWVHYAALPSLEAALADTPLTQFPGLQDVLPALEAQRKRDFEEWMAALGLDAVVFPSQGDVGLADLEFELDSARQSLQNGVKYSNGNRALRHLGVPTVSVPMGTMEERGMPVNLTFAGRAYEDGTLLGYAYAFEQRCGARVVPPLTPGLESDAVVGWGGVSSQEMAAVLDLTAAAPELTQGKQILLKVGFRAHGTMARAGVLEVWVNGIEAYRNTLDRLAEQNEPREPLTQRSARFVPPLTPWLQLRIDCEGLPLRPQNEILGWDLKPLKPRPAMVVVVLRAENALTKAKLLWLQC
ncbi:amidase signature enzyme [Paraphaeosphaeria sporulosa]|uniref:Amidase signature enzyme n=1 Tax=Paraphaeosphaeria sporulosa TaxID=1460663 RepID=A0A177CA37_9PLEO|nr:amidase signature enzyme [Paraphaeosphaeria sporulosa]OAG03991.1 amidase signature enzyme [Paraphaeosphaeria sporulosa]